MVKTLELANYLFLDFRFQIWSPKYYISPYDTQFLINKHKNRGKFLFTFPPMGAMRGSVLPGPSPLALWTVCRPCCGMVTDSCILFTFLCLINTYFQGGNEKKLRTTLRLLVPCWGYDILLIVYLFLFEGNLALSTRNSTTVAAKNMGQGS
jgi:hypothetical protein